MFEELPGSEGKILALKGMGKITDRDYKEVLRPKFDERVRKHGKARLILVMGDEFRGFGPRAALDEAGFGIRHLMRSETEKVAVVGGPRWFRWGARASAYMSRGPIKAFRTDKLDEAWHFIKD